MRLTLIGRNSFIIFLEHFRAFMFNNIRTDFRRYNLKKRQCAFNFFLYFRSLIGAYGFHAILVYRYGHWIKKKLASPCWIPLRYPLYGLYLFLNWCIMKCYDIRLSQEAEIGPGFYIGHFGGIDVGKCRIGRNCSVQQHTKINQYSVSNHFPQIGSSVWIGAHSIINGNVIIGDGATIAAGAVVKNDIDRKCLVVGDPARIINNNYDNTEILEIVL
jgi:serine O-acetyltransferase